PSMLLSSGAYLPGPDQKSPLPTSGAHVLERDSSEPANRFGNVPPKLARPDRHSSALRYRPLSRDPVCPEIYDGPEHDMLQSKAGRQTGPAGAAPITTCSGLDSTRVRCSLSARRPPLASVR